MSVRAQVLSPWGLKVVAGEPTNYPQVLIDYPPDVPGTGWDDVTGTPGENLPITPNAIVVDAYWADATFDLVKADPAYTNAIQWSAGPADYKPRTASVDALEFGRLRSHLASRLGFSPAHVDDAVGEMPAGRTRQEIAARLAAWLRDRPKATA